MCLVMHNKDKKELRKIMAQGQGLVYSATIWLIIFLVPILKGALRVLTAYCTKHGLVQCGRKGGAEGGVAKRIIQQEQNAVQRYGAIRCCHGVVARTQSKMLQHNLHAM